MTADSIAGAFTVNATVSGALTPAIFNLTNLFYKSGDINADGKVNVQDLFTMANFLAGNTHLNATESAAADVFDDQTGKINVQDLLTMANFLAGNTHTLPVIAGSNAPPAATVAETDLIFEPRRFVMGLDRDGQILYSDDYLTARWSLIRKTSLSVYNLRLTDIHVSAAPL